MSEVLCAAVIFGGDVHSVSSASVTSCELRGASVSCRLWLRMRGQADPSMFLIQEDQLVMVTVWAGCQLGKDYFFHYYIPTQHGEVNHSYRMNSVFLAEGFSRSGSHIMPYILFVHSAQ